MLKLKFRLSKEKNRLYVGLLVLLVLGLFTGFNAGYYEAIGIYPFTTQQAIMPAEITTLQTFEDVGDFIAKDITNKEPYEEGMNCVDYALVVARNAQWMGLNPEVVKLDYKVGLSHAMLMFLTADQGWIFVDPQTDKVFDVFVIGQMYGGKEIIALSVLELSWKPFEKFFEGGNNNE